MIEILKSFNLTAAEWIITAICGILIGIAKTGFGGAGMPVIPILASIFGGKPSTGLLLPMLCFGDIIGVAYFHRHAEWHHILRLIPWSLAGIILGLIVGNIISDTQFNGIIAVTVLGGIVLMLLQERPGREIVIPDNRWFSALIGLAGGFTSMVGNAAGPVMALYLLSMRMPKYSFIGTWAWFFLIVNFSKLPLHAFFWGTVTVKTLAFDAAMIPSIVVGAVIGITVVKKIPEKTYRIFIIVLTALAAVKLFI